MKNQNEKVLKKEFYRKEFMSSLIIFLASLACYFIVMKCSGRNIRDLDFSSGLLFSPALCVIFITISFLMSLLFYLIKKENLLGIIYTIQVCAAGYFIMEILYQYFHFTIPVPQNPPWLSAWVFNFNTYLFHRAHQYIAMAFIIILLYHNSEKREGTTLKAGNINITSDFLGPKKILSWKLIALRLAGMFMFFSVIFLILKLKLGKLDMNEIKNSIYMFMFIPLFLGAVNHSFIEELLFRGIFLSRFKSLMDEKYANYLQAILFGLFHSQFLAIFSSPVTGNGGGMGIAILIQLFILIIYTFLGWILGRSALETGGMGTSTFIHASIVVSIYLSKGFIY